MDQCSLCDATQASEGQRRGSVTHVNVRLRPPRIRPPSGPESPETGSLPVSCVQCDESAQRSESGPHSSATPFESRTVRENERELTRLNQNLILTTNGAKYLAQCREASNLRAVMGSSPSSRSIVQWVRFNTHDPIMCTSSWRDKKRNCSGEEQLHADWCRNRRNAPCLRSPPRTGRHLKHRTAWGSPNSRDMKAGR